MAIHDKHRARKTYTFNRVKPVPFEADLIITTNLLSFSGSQINLISELPYISIPGTFMTGTVPMIFVNSVKDYFVYSEETNYATEDNITNISSNTSSGFWYRLELRNPFWKKQTDWFIDFINGNDENSGSLSLPIKTHAELERRIFDHILVEDDYNVYFISNSTEEIETSFQLNGGSITYHGLLTNTSSLTHQDNDREIDGSSLTGPYVTVASTSPNADVLFNSNLEFIGLSYEEYNHSPFATINTTPSSGSITSTILNTTLMQCNFNMINAKGSGDVTFKNLHVTSSNVNSNDANIKFYQSILEGAENQILTLRGNDLIIEQSKLTSPQEINTFNVNMFVSQSLILSTTLDLKNSACSFDASIIASSIISSSNSAVNFNIVTPTSGCLFTDGSDFVVMHNNLVDAGNYFHSASQQNQKSIDVSLSQNSMITHPTSQYDEHELLLHDGLILSWSTTPYSNFGNAVTIIEEP